MQCLELGSAEDPQDHQRQFRFSLSYQHEGASLLAQVRLAVHSFLPTS